MNDPHARSAGRRLHRRAGSFTPCLRICGKVEGRADGTLRRLSAAVGASGICLAAREFPQVGGHRGSLQLHAPRPLQTAMAEDNL